MSYDVSLISKKAEKCPTCGHDPSGAETYFSANHTSNTAGMWRHAGCDIAEFDGKLASELGASLKVAIDAMRANPGLYKPMEPDNGWGTYESTLKFMINVLLACESNPDAEVHVWR